MPAYWSLLVVAVLIHSAAAQPYLVLLSYNSGTCNTASLKDSTAYRANTCFTQSGATTSMKYNCPEGTASLWSTADCSGTPQTASFPAGCFQGSSILCSDAENPTGQGPIAELTYYSTSGDCSSQTGWKKKSIFFGGCNNAGATSTPITTYECSSQTFTRANCNETATCGTCSYESSTLDGSCSNVAGDWVRGSCGSSGGSGGSPQVGRVPQFQPLPTPPAAPQRQWSLVGLFVPGTACASAQPFRYTSISNKCANSATTSLIASCTSNSFGIQTYNGLDCQAGSETGNSMAIFDACDSAEGRTFSCGSNPLPALTGPYVQQETYSSNADCVSGSDTVKDRIVVDLPRCNFAPDSNSSSLTFCNSTGIYLTNCTESSNCAGISCQTTLVHSNLNTCSLEGSTWFKRRCIAGPAPAQANAPARPDAPAIVAFGDPVGGPGVKSAASSISKALALFSTGALLLLALL